MGRPYLSPPPRPGRRGLPLQPLALYIHWPYCARICPYCDFNVVRDRGRIEEQAELGRAIIADFEGHRAVTGPRRLVSIYFGGGTPSLMPPLWAGEMIAAARSLWTPDPGLEITLEANPTDAEVARFSAFADAGVERLSLGLQSLDDKALTFLGRDHTARQGMRAAQLARHAFRRLSIDLIYARPGQTTWAWAAELEAATVLGAEHISPYQLTIEGGTAFERAVRRGAWQTPDTDTGAAMFETTQEVLNARGFQAYEVSNHARGEAARSRHNLAYWRGEDYVGVGPGAHGRLTISGARTATRAAPRVRDYIAKVKEEGVGWDERETLSLRQAAEERLLMGLRTLEGVGLGEVAALGLGADNAKLGELAQAGLILVDDDRIAATCSGRMVLDRITTELALANPDAVAAAE
jgi:putative oxygen-independent coproporphyrinogen III oxidase